MRLELTIIVACQWFMFFERGKFGLKIAVRIKETATRVRLAFAANCPDADLIRSLTPRPT
jgi:hypothetical protein